MDSKDRDKIRAAAEKVRGYNELNPNNRKRFVIKVDILLAILTALDEAEKEKDWYKDMLKSITYMCLDCDHEIDSEKCNTCPVIIAKEALTQKGDKP